jgi:hypothetical protein
MNTWLKIYNNVVINVVTQESTPPDDELGKWVLQTNPMQSPGWFYDETGVLRRPVDQPWFIITKQAFIDRFTTDEWSAIQQNALNTPAIQSALEYLNGVEKVALPASSTLRAIEAFVNSGCVTRERANELIVAAHEDEVADITAPSVPSEGP